MEEKQLQGGGDEETPVEGRRCSDRLALPNRMGAGEECVRATCTDVCPSSSACSFFTGVEHLSQEISPSRIPAIVP